MTFIPGGCCDDYPECWHRVEEDQYSRITPITPALPWCERCKSCHTVEFGKQFHGRVLKPIVFEAEECNIQAGDIVSFSNVYTCSRWWQFWHWFRKPKPQHKLFVVQERK